MFEQLKRQSDAANCGREMPRYKCHKEVWALKIGEIHRGPEPPSDYETDGNEGGAMIVPADDGYGPFFVSAEFLRRHKPTTGGYYVVYKDGYASFSPAAAFEDGYTRI